MKLHKISVLTLLLAVRFIASCSYDKDILSPQSNCSTINAKFSANINPIIQSSCAINSSCHGSGSVNGPGELLTYTQVHAAANIIRVAVETRFMPLGSSLSQENINKISCWVNSGAPNN